MEPGADAKGNITRIDNELDRIAPRLTAVRNRLDNLLQQQKAAQAEVGKPFPFEKELGEKTARLALLDMQLSLDRPEAEPEQAMERSVPHPAVRRFPEAGRKRGRER